eukprot:5951096-Pyramimonas_sp.AAC.1
MERWETSPFPSLTGCSAIQATSWPSIAATRTSLSRPHPRRSSTTFDSNLTPCLETGLLQCIRQTIAN